MTGAGGGTASARRVRARVTARRGEARRAGMIVALLGPDGAGKTTLARGLASTADLRARRIYLGTNPRERGAWWSRPARPELPGRGAAARVRAPLRIAARGTGFLHRLADQWRRYLAARRHRRAGGVVVFDRYAAGAYRNGDTGGSPPSLRRRLLDLGAPEPDLVVVLDAPAGVLRERKGEHPPERLERMRRDYLRLGRAHPCGVVVDAVREPSVVLDEVSRLIQARLSGGAERRP